MFQASCLIPDIIKVVATPAARPAPATSNPAAKGVAAPKLKITKATATITRMAPRIKPKALVLPFLFLILLNYQ